MLIILLSALSATQGDVNSAISRLKAQRWAYGSISGLCLCCDWTVNSHWM